MMSCLFLVLFGCSTDDPTRQNTFVPLTSIEVTPTYQSMANQTVNQYRAIGNFSGAFTREITQEAAWSTDNEFIASVNTGLAGLVKAHAPGETTVTAWYGDISGNAPVVVSNATLAGIEISPQDAELPVGITKQYEAVGTFSDSSTQDITSLVTWESSNTNFATIDETGLATALTSGSVTITGAWQGVNSNTTLLVTDNKITAITIAPANATIAQGTTVQFSAEGTLSDGSKTDITATVNWQSSDNSIAIVDTAGFAEGISPGQTEISASLDENGIIISSTTVLNVSDALVISIAITPANETIQAGDTLQYTATGTLSDNTQQDITWIVTWVSNDSTVGSISNASSSRGLFKSSNPGTTFIEAFYINGNGVEIGDSVVLLVQ